MPKRNNTRRNNYRRGGRRNNTVKAGLFRRVYNVPSAGIHAVRNVAGTGLNLLVNVPTNAVRGAKNIVKKVTYKGLNGINSGLGRVFSGANNVVSGAAGVFKSRKNRRVGGRRNNTRRRTMYGMMYRKRKNNNTRKTMMYRKRKNNSRGMYSYRKHRGGYANMPAPPMPMNPMMHMDTSKMPMMKGGANMMAMNPMMPKHMGM